MVDRRTDPDRAFPEEGPVSRKGCRLVAKGHPRLDDPGLNGRARPGAASAALRPTGASAAGKPYTSYDTLPKGVHCPTATATPPRGNANHASSLPGNSQMTARGLHLPLPLLRVVHLDTMRPNSPASRVAVAYRSTKDLCARFRRSSRTLFRRMKRTENPFHARA
jgi:hypothetical protein